jgi:flagellar hook-associated protein 1 FlgK
MALFPALNTALSGLQTQISALQTAAHNVANAATPGYSRQRVEIEANRPLDLVFAQLGTGVRLKAIRRIIDQSLEERLQNATSLLAQFKVKSDVLTRLEAALAGLTEHDIGAALDRLFGAIQDLSSRPEDLSARTLVIQHAGVLSDVIGYLSKEIRDSRDSLDTDLNSVISDINRLTTEIAELNHEIVSAENAGMDLGAANDLRDKRGLRLKELAELINIKTVETSTGEVNVLNGGSFLVLGGESFSISTTKGVDMGSIITTPLLSNGTGILKIESGKLAGIISARDELLRDALVDLDLLANALIFEFNKVHSQGQGLKRFSELTSQNSVISATYPLAISGTVTSSATEYTFTDASLVGFPNPVGQDILILSGENILQRRRIVAFESGTGTITVDTPFIKPLSQGDRFQIGPFDFQIQNGSFDFVITNELSGEQSFTNIELDLDRLPAGPGLDDTTLQDIVNAINSINPGVIIAEITNDNRLYIRSNSPDLTISFANDTSGFLAAMGLNNMFTGHESGDMGVHTQLVSDPSFFSAARSNNAGDNSNVLAMLELRTKVTVKQESSFEEFYQGLVGKVAVATAEFKDRTEHQQFLNQQLENQRQRISGVNIDEEAINMIIHQRAFQASARLIAVVDRLLETLVTVT